VEEVVEVRTAATASLEGLDQMGLTTHVGTDHNQGDPGVKAATAATAE
jgi:hypothetical protein